MWTESKGTESTKVNQDVARVVELPIPRPSSGGINREKAPWLKLDEVSQIFNRIRTRGGRSHNSNSARRLSFYPTWSSLGRSSPIRLVAWPQAMSCSMPSHCDNPSLLKACRKVSVYIALVQIIHSPVKVARGLISVEGRRAVSLCPYRHRKVSQKI